MFTSREYGKIKAEAEKQGADAGANLAEWAWQDTFGGRGSGTEDDARKFLQGIDNGDPLYLDRIPRLDLSGQWAGDPTWDDTFDGIVWEVCKEERIHDDDYDASSDECFMIFTDAASLMAVQWTEDALRAFIAS